MINENLTKLPEYWYCELTDESRDTLNNWRKNIIKYSDTNCPYKWIREGGNGGFVQRKREGEISFNQFKKWVLKEEKPKQDLSKTVVHCTTQEEWDYVINRITTTKKKEWFGTDDGYNRVNDCLTLDGKNYCYLDWYKEQSQYTILSFSEWCKQFNHTPNFMKVEESIAEKLPTVVELVAGDIYNFSWNGGINYTFKKGVAKAIDKDSYYSYFIEPDYEQYKDSIRPATPEEKQWLNACIEKGVFIPKEEALSIMKVEEKPKFEVGKFYQIKTSYIWIVKCKSLNDNLFISEWYYDMDGKTFTKGCGGWNLEMVKLIKELSLEEIQQYLPEGHPDKIVEEQNKKEMFYKDDYIVNIGIDDGGNSFQLNHCFKQRIDGDYLIPYNDGESSKTNGWSAINFKGANWRYATKEEIAEYDRLMKPFDTSNWLKKEDSISEYVECIKKCTDSTLGKIYKVKSREGKDTISWFDDKSTNRGTYSVHFKPSTKEAYDKQQESLKPKEIVMDKDELLIKAKRDYPIGTEFKSAYSGNTFKVNSIPNWNSVRDSIIGGEFGSLYCHGKWAEIISKPEIKERGITITDVNEVFPFVKGKYYSCVYTETQGEFYFQYLTLDENELFFTGCRSVEDENIWKEVKSSWLYSENKNFKEVTEQEAKGIEVKKEVDKWTVGGWVRIIKSSNHKGLTYNIGEYYQIEEYKDDEGREFGIYPKVPRGVEGRPFLYCNTECEWIGMENPLETFNDVDFGVHVHLHHPKTGICACGHSAMAESNNWQESTMRNWISFNEIRKRKLFYPEWILPDYFNDSTNQLKIKSDVTRIDTSLPKINSISINLKTKTKTIKF